MVAHMSRFTLGLLALTATLLPIPDHYIESMELLPFAEKEWTVLIYQGADNDLEDALLRDFNEMERVGTTTNLNIVVQIDRSPNNYDTSDDNWTNTRRYLVNKDPNETPPGSGIPNSHIVSTLLQNLPKQNMASENVFVDFVMWGIANFPAKRYFLILADHGWGVRPFQGSGVRRGLIQSETFGNDFLTSPELKSAFTQIKAVLGRKLDVVGYDASEMSQLENAYLIRNDVEWLVASQLSEPNDGYPYDQILQELASRPTISTKLFLQKIVTHYMNSYVSGQPTVGAGDSVTIAIYNTANLQPIVDAVDTLAHELLKRHVDLKDTLNNIRSRTQMVGETIYRDLYHFAEVVKANISDTDVQAAAQAIIDAHGPSPTGALLLEAHRTGGDINVEDAHGISVYLPQENLYSTLGGFEPSYLTELDFAQDTKWGKLLETRADSDAPQINERFPMTSEPLLLVRPALSIELTDRGNAEIAVSSIAAKIDGTALSKEALTFNEINGTLTIIPLNPLSIGTHSIEITASDNNGNAAQPLTFNIVVQPPTLPKGISMIGLPIGASESDPRSVLNDSGAQLARWNPSENEWKLFPNEAFASLVPPDTGPTETVDTPPAGLGYFSKLTRTAIFNYAGMPLLPDETYSIGLKMGSNGAPGWNQFSNPFPTTVPWSQVEVRSGAQTMSIAEAIAARLILSRPFRYIQNPNDPNLPGEYEALSGDALTLKPFEANWLKVGEDVTLLIRGPTAIGSKGHRGNLPIIPEYQVPTVQGWQLRLMAFCGNTQDSFNFVGMAYGASNKFDAGDSPEPPIIPGTAIRLCMPRTTWGRYADDYSTDMRPSSSKATWDFTVEAHFPATEVVLAWEGLEYVPSQYRLLLTDLTTGSQIPMRIRSSYRFQTPTQETVHVRHFRLTALPRSMGRLIISNVQLKITVTNSYLNFSLSAPARISVALRTLAGRTVRRIVVNRAMGIGRQYIDWDLRDLQGHKMPPGFYVCEILGEDELGQSTITIHTFAIH